MSAKNGQDYVWTGRGRPDCHYFMYKYQAKEKCGLHQRIIRVCFRFERVFMLLNIGDSCTLKDGSDIQLATAFLNGFDEHYIGRPEIEFISGDEPHELAWRNVMCDRKINKIIEATK